MTDLINDQVQRLSSAGPVALHPVRNDRNFREQSLTESQSLIGSGSALIALNIAEEIADAWGPPVFLAPNLVQLRDERVRSVVLVDDFVGSGRSVIECINRWRSDPTIRSWSSYHLIQFHLLAYSYSASGYAKVIRSGVLDQNQVRTHSVADDFSRAEWTDEEEREIRRICHQYADNRRNALGTGGSAALIVFDHTVPNNLPRILLQDRGRAGKDWTPFFAPGDRRMLPAQSAELAGYRPPGTYDYRYPGSPGLVESEQNILDRDMLRVLRSIESGRTLTRQIQEATFLTDFQVRALLVRARHIGFVGEHSALTESGFEWVDRQRHDSPVPTEDVFTQYYPTQLRGADEI